LAEARLHQERLEDLTELVAHGYAHQEEPQRAQMQGKHLGARGRAGGAVVAGILVGPPIGARLVDSAGKTVSAAG
jgi:hypothetical protein